jgi:hypothetical protein
MLDHVGDEGRGEGRGVREVELAAVAEAHLALLRLLRERQGRQAEDQSLERRGDGSRVGDVVAEIGAVVDARDDQLRPAAEQAQVGEPHAVHRGALGRVSDRPVVEVHLIDPDRRARRDRPCRGAAIGVRGDHVQLDALDLEQSPTQRLQARRGQAVVVGEQDSHATIVWARLDRSEAGR